MALKGRTSRKILYTAFLALDISLFTQLIAFLPSTGMSGISGGRVVRPTAVLAPMSDDTPKTVQSVHVGRTLDVQVVQQPEGDANYVSPNDGELTQFAAVSQYGNIGLLAHNYLAGGSFSRMVVGQDVLVLYNNGETENFVVTEILTYQALDPKSPYSSFQSLQNGSEMLSAGEMFDRVYQGAHHLTFQTCIAREGISSWGRLFVVAKPKPLVTRFDAGTLQAIRRH